MKSKALTIAASMTMLMSCTSNHGNQPATTSSGQFSNPALSADTNARLEKIDQDYGVLLGVDVSRHVIIINEPHGLVDTRPTSPVIQAIREVFGKDFANYTISPGLVD
jgi:hypothetical protein